MNNGDDSRRIFSPYLAGLRSLALIFCALCLCQPVAAATVAEVRPGALKLNLNPYLEYLRDASGGWTLDDVRSAPVEQQFRASPSAIFSAGFTRDVYWFRVTVQYYAGPTGHPPAQRVVSDHVLELGFPMLDEVHVYWPRTGGGWEVLKTGDHFDFSERQMPHRNFALPVSLPPGQPTTFYLRVKTNDPMIVPVTLWSRADYYQQDQSAVMLLGLFYGINLVIIVFNAFVYLSFRDRLYFDYILFAAMVTLWWPMSLDGIGTQYLWGNSPWFTNIAAAFFAVLAGSTGVRFGQGFLQTRLYVPGLDRVLFVYRMSCLICAAVILFLDPLFANLVTLALALTGIAMVVVTLFMAQIRVLRAARFLILASVAIVAGVAIKWGQLSGFFPTNPGTLYALHIGVTFGTVLMALALTDRFHSERSEKENLAAAREHAEATTHAKSEFLAKMSHEIRTPMNAIIGFTDLALRTDREPKRLDFLRHIRDASQSLLTIINDILDLSKIEAGKLALERQEFSLQAIMDKVAVLFSQRAAEKGLELILSNTTAPRVLIGDPLRLEQILVNLTSNALKFTDHGEVEVSVIEEPQSAQGVRLKFSVRDTGIGLSPEQLDRLFDPFAQADESTTRKYGGTGLGLSICKQLTDMMGGEIGVSSVLGQGSTFFLTLSLDGKGIDQEAGRGVPVALRGVRALVVDDNPTACRVHQSLMQSMGLACDVVNDGAAAIQRFREGHYGLILLDWRMPGMDGLETARQIRALPNGAQARIVMITASIRSELLRNVVEDNLINASLSKPVTPAALLDTLVEVFEGQVNTELAMGGLGDSPAMGRLSGARVLLVEDNALNQHLATEIMHELGIRVDVAGNGQEGVSAVERGGYNAVLMDIQMPVMDGLEATRRIRQKPEFTKLPIIALTANALLTDRARCLTAGMDDYLAKPIIAAQLAGMLAKWIGGAEASTASTVPAPPLRNHHGTRLAPPIDIEAALDQYDGNRKLYRELLEIYSQHHAQDLEKLRAALERRDMPAAHRLVHTLKGVAGNLGMQELRESAAALEDRIEEGGTLSDAERQRFEQAFAAVQSALAQTLSSLAPFPGPESTGAG